MLFQDQIGREISLTSVPERIVSLVPSQTELLVSMGLEEKLVGVTKFCVHPVHLRKEKSIVGGTKQVDLEKIKQLQPDLILCNKEENTLEMVKALSEIGPVHVSDVVTVKDCFKLILQYGQIFSIDAFAEKIVDRIKQEIALFKLSLNQDSRKKVAYIIWKEPLMAAGQDTFINSLLELNNFENVVKEKRYPVVEVDDLKEKGVDLVLLSSEPYPFKEAHKALFQNLNTKVMLVDGEFFSWYGTRLLRAISYFKSLHD